MLAFGETNVRKYSKGNWRTRDIFVGVLDQQERKRKKKRKKYKLKKKKENGKSSWSFRVWRSTIVLCNARAA